MCCDRFGEKHCSSVPGLAVVMKGQIGKQKRGLGKEGMVVKRANRRNTGPDMYIYSVADLGPLGAWNCRSIAFRPGRNSVQAVCALPAGIRRYITGRPRSEGIGGKSV
jgi:hypothetical protein